MVYTLDTHGEDYLETQEGRKLPVVHCIKGTDGHKLASELEGDLADCRCFEKPVFGSAELGEYIGKLDFESVELCGLVSNICVISNAVVARTFAPEAEIIVDSSLTASAFPDLHKAALDVLSGIQVTVI